MPGLPKKLSSQNTGSSQTTADIFDKLSHPHPSDPVYAKDLWPYWKIFEPAQENDPLTQVRYRGQPMLMFGSNDYLALTRDPRVVEAAAQAAKSYGTGFGGSRYLNGSFDIHQALEEELADFLGVEAALLFGTGYQTNVGALSTIAGRDDVIIADRQNHACLNDGALLSGARVIRFQHNDTTHLETCLQQNTGHKAQLIVVEGIYSLEGDVAVLPEIVRLADTHQARIFLDDAHGIGVLGNAGRGTAEHFTCLKNIDVLSCTFSKSFASSGGFVAGSKSLIDYLKRASRQFIYSASVTPPVVATARASLAILRKEPERPEKVRRIAEYCRTALRQVGFPVNEGISAIVSIPFPDSPSVCRFVNLLVEEGAYVNPVISNGSSKDLIRISITAAHETADVDKLISKMIAVAR